MRARVSWTLVLAAFLAFPSFQRERVEEMGFGEIFRIERMRVDPALTQALRSRWDTEASAFAFPWGHMIPSLEDVSQITGLGVYGRAVNGYTYPCYHDLAERLLDLPVERRSSLVPRVALQESLGLYEAGKNAGESEDEYLARLARVSRRELASEPGPQADLDLRRFLVLFLGRLLFATRGDAVHCRFLPLLDDLGEVGGYAWGVAFLAHQFDGLSASERQTSTSGFYPFLQVWAYLHLPALRRGDLTRLGLVPIARLWDSHRDTRHLVDQLERLQEVIYSYPYLDVVWQPYLGEGDEGQPWLAQARPYFGRSVWLHALNLVLPLNLFLTQRSLGLRQSVVEFSIRDRFRRPGRSFRGLHDMTDWRERAREQIENWEQKGKGVDVTGEIASLRALLQSAVQDREAAQRQTAELRSEQERVRGTEAGGASSSRSTGGSPSLLEARLTGAVLRAEEAQRHLEERERDLELAHEHAMELQSERDRFRGEVQTTRSERDQLRIRAEAVEAQVAEMARELVTLRVQRPPGDQEEVTRLRAELLAQQTLARGLQQIVTDIGRSRSRSRSGASVSRATGASVGQYLAGSSSRQTNEEEERHRQGEGSAHDGRGGGEMLPPPDRREGSGESGGGQ
ncbi:hypothetical protein Taro_046266 [Colocasia esculenta]|uniref:Aminotransferase-like plant mobile domain-containing protein n=1 Tax=Colocasia esculenta TaxID=4460 RepID=A0A843X791_COLES|nr:hypothetical protein [Colocasia esculenta]